VPRLSSLGLFTEAAANNLISYSQQFTPKVGAPWAVVNGLTLGANNYHAPDLTNSATRVDFLSASSYLNFGVNGAFNFYVTGQPYTASLFVSPITTNFVELFIVSGNVGFQTQEINFNLANGYTVVGQGNNVISSSVQPLANNWYRVQVTFTVTANAYNAGMQIRAPTAGQPGFVAGASQALYIWGAQIETGSIATSYFPTTTSAAGFKRANEIASLTFVGGVTTTINALNGNTVLAASSPLSLGSGAGSWTGSYLENVSVI